MLFFKKKKKAKIGLALGGGGAKGMAELGALKAFEENGIEFDMVSGTSIGSIIGALYANGYTSDDMLALLKSIDISEIKTLVMIKMDTAPVERILERLIGKLTFAELKKPYFCWATNVLTGEGREFSEGHIIKPVTASSAMPPFFKAVEIDGEPYCDGVYANLIPADSLKSRGCDYVVGIDLSTYTVKSKLSGILDLFTYKVPILKDGKEAGYKNADIMLQPDLTGMTALSTDKLDVMYNAGYNEATARMDEIKKKLTELKIFDKKGKRR